MSASLRARDAGVQIIMVVKDNGGIVDISAADTKEILFLAPSGAVLTRDAEFKTDGVNGQLLYTTQAADFTEEGNWGAQAHVVIDDLDVRSAMTPFRVERAVA